MSNELLDMLENKVFSTIETIELMRLEINELKDERRLMEQKVRELIQRIEGVDNSAQPAAITAASDTSSEEAASLDGATALGQTGTDY